VLVRQKGVSVTDIRLERGRLEDVFRAVTTTSEAGGGR
jgi:hypothetical protein